MKSDPYGGSNNIQGITKQKQMLGVIYNYSIPGQMYCFSEQV